MSIYSGLQLCLSLKLYSFLTLVLNIFGRFTHSFHSFCIIVNGTFYSYYIFHWLFLMNGKATDSSIFALYPTKLITVLH